MLTCIIVRRATGFVFVARVMTPAVVFRDCLDTSCSHSVSGRTSHRVLSRPRTPLSCSSSVAHHDKLRFALIDRSELVEPSLCLDTPHHRDCLRTHSQMLRSRHLLQLPLEALTYGGQSSLGPGPLRLGPLRPGPRRPGLLRPVLPRPGLLRPSLHRPVLWPKSNWSKSNRRCSLFFFFFLLLHSLLFRLAP